MTVLVWGVPTESPIALVAEELTALAADVVIVHPGRAAEYSLTMELNPSRPAVTGVIRVGTRRVGLAELTGVYLRPIEPDLVPQLGALAPQSVERCHARSVHDALVAYTEIAEVAYGTRVVNRLSAMASNMSKPFQAQAVLARGFHIPETLVTDDPDEALAFAERFSDIIYKSTSGVRSIVTAFDRSTDVARLPLLRWCPVQFQERVFGADVRVHVVGTDVFAAIVESNALDYRYARSQVGIDATLRPYRLSPDIAQRCIALADDLDLPFAGIDLKLADDGRVVCFEVNPSPGFSWYQLDTGLPIAEALARWLLG
jgi:glutathione synthase/RimK-type ligase-like ATP-grasp enzyme